MPLPLWRGIFFIFSLMKVLIIEDEPALRQSIQTYLEHQGFLCEGVGDFLTVKISKAVSLVAKQLFFILSYAT